MTRTADDGQAPARTIGLLGGLGICPVARLSVPSRRLLALLAIQRGPTARSAVAGQLWPDQPDPVARANLRRYLWQTPPGWVLTVGDELVLDADVDLREAREIAANALVGHPVDLAAILLLDNDLLPGWQEEWLFGPQEAFRLLRVQALEAACRTHTLRGDHVLAIQAGAAALDAEPLRESAAVAMVAAHLAQGNRHAALTEFRAFAVRLRRELGIDPAAELLRLVDGVVPTARSA